MKLLFDQQLSRRLPKRLSDLYPGSRHLTALGLDTAEDEEIWDIALAGGYTIVTKDSDYRDLSLFRGHPPRVIWLRVGNCPTSVVEGQLRSRHVDVVDWDENSPSGILVLV